MAMSDREPTAQMPERQPARSGLLALVFGVTVLLALRAIVRPEVARERTFAVAFDFPEAVPLENWQLQRQQPWSPPQERDRPLARARSAGVEYAYVAPEGGQLQARVRFISRAGNGNTSRLLQTYTAVQPATVRIDTSYREGKGFYGFFIFAGEASILACINAQGDTTVTGQQFSQTITLKPERLFPWLLGRQDLFDRSCLFSILSVPARPTETSLEDYPELEAAWLGWVARWQQADWSWRYLEVTDPPEADARD